MKHPIDPERAPRTDGRFALLASTLLASCTVNYTMEEFDELARQTEARTILLDEEFSLYSPYDWIQTRSYADLFRKQRAEVFALFGVEHAPPTLIQLHPNSGLGAQYIVEGNGVGIRGISLDPDGGFSGRAPGNWVILEVDPPQVLRLEDGRSLASAFDASMFERTIRHELTHVAVFLLGVEEGGWLHEGLAHAVAEIPVEDGRLRPDPSHALLAFAASLASEDRSLRRLLEWRQQLPVTEADHEARALACSLVLFVLERDGAPSLREGFPRLAARDRASLLALEGEWSAWLDRFAPAAGPTAARPAL